MFITDFYFKIKMLSGNVLLILIDNKRLQKFAQVINKT